MMAFFLLMWLLGATTEKQRKSIADYFNPTLVETKQASAGSFGPLGGDSILARDNFAHAATGVGNRIVASPIEADPMATDRKRFDDLKRALATRLASDASLKRYLKNIRFTDTREGLRIDIVDEADWSMFARGTDKLSPDARTLVDQVARVASDLPNDLIVRGHTDAAPFAGKAMMNNWLLSSARAEATRAALVLAGLPPTRFARIEGVADREPYTPGDRFDPRNRRMSVTLAWLR
jgi:chemotaxis protein MotB